MIGGQYLKARFGFEFAEAVTPEIQAVQDALFTHAAAVATLRTGLRKLLRSMEDDLGYMTNALDRGGLYVPLGEGAARDPYALARRIEHEEQGLKIWCAAVARLQESSA